MTYQTDGHGIARATHALLLRQEGLKLREIGARLGVSPDRARQLIFKGKWATEHPKTSAADELPNQIHNALRWHLKNLKDGQEITPALIKENAAAIFGHPVINLGKKGKSTLLAWCKKHGVDLGVDDPLYDANAKNERRRLQAVQLLRRIHAETGDKNICKAIALLALEAKGEPVT